MRLDVKSMGKSLVTRMLPLQGSQGAIVFIIYYYHLKCKPNLVKLESAPDSLCSAIKFLHDLPMKLKSDHRRRLPPNNAAWRRLIQKNNKIFSAFSALFVNSPAWFVSCLSDFYQDRDGHAIFYTKSVVIDRAILDRAPA